MSKRKCEGEEERENEKKCRIEYDGYDEYRVLKGNPYNVSSQKPYYVLWRSFLKREERKNLFNQCMPGGSLNIKWETQNMPIPGGGMAPLPRKTAFLSPIENLCFKYSNMESYAQLMPPEIKTIMDQVGKQVGEEFNAVFMNLYENGSHYIGFHRDSESGIHGGMVKNSKIASLSLGATRRFVLLHSMHKTKPGNSKIKKERHERGEYFCISLDAGTLFLMGPFMQEWWHHSIMKEPESKHTRPRINMTFRKFVI